MASTRALLLAGVPFSVLWLAGGALYGTGFPRSGAAEAVAGVLVADRFRLSLGISLVLLAWIFFLPFLVGLAQAMRRREGGDGSLTFVALLAGVLLAGLFLLDHAMNAAGLFREVASEDLRAWYAVGAGDLVGQATAVPRTALLLAVGWALLAHDAKAWAGWVGVGYGALSAVGIFFAVRHPIVDTVSFLAFAAFPFWVLAMALALEPSEEKPARRASAFPRV